MSVKEKWALWRQLSSILLIGAGFGLAHPMWSLLFWGLCWTAFSRFYGDYLLERLAERSGEFYD